MAHRISVESRADHSRAARLFATLKDRYPRSRLTGVSLSRAYTTDAKLRAKSLERAVAVLTNPVIETSSATRVLSPSAFSHAIEIGFRPAVTDNAGNSARQMIEDATGIAFKNGDSVYSSLFVFLEGDVSAKDAARMAGELHNPLIERATITASANWKQGRIPLIIPKVKLPRPAPARAVNLEVPDEELARIGKEGIEDGNGIRRGPLALSLAELHAIRDYFRSKKRSPTDVELESLAQTWSEHCKHTIFNDPLDEIREGIYKRYIRGATEKVRAKKGVKDFCVSVFKDNSGAIAFNDEYLVTHKMETHNTPSALDPYGGAITGILGVNRDALGFGLGAKPIANLFGYCVGEPSDTRTLYRDAKKTRPMLTSARILEGVVKGIEAGGNQSGIPTPLGFVYADESYRGKPLVFAGTIGLIPRKKGGRELHKKRARAGDYIVVAGGRVGADGIHGATFSSEALSAESPATAVQIGDAITQKKLSDAIVRELRDKNLYSSITDNGAGGISCSVAEMAQECGGCAVDLSKVPLKYPGLAPWQIWISESQERVTFSVPPTNWKAMKKILDKHGTEAVVIGRFTDSGSCIVTYDGKKVMDVSLDFLHDGRPKHEQKTNKVAVKSKALPARLPSIDKALLSLLARPTVGSYDFISSQYDHEVQGLSVTKPLQGRGRVNADAAVMRPVASDTKGIVLSHGYAPSLAELDAYKMAAASIDIAIRNALAAGGTLDTLAILDNFCWSTSGSPERLYQLKEAARACYDYAVAYGTPYISGKDSMYNDFRGFDEQGKPVHVAVMPTLLISAIGVMKDARSAITLDFKAAGDSVYVLGKTRAEFGGSEFAKLAAGTFYAGQAPATDANENTALYRAFGKAARMRLMSSALAVSRGGVGVALAKMALAGARGANVSFAGNAHAALFSESTGRFVITVAPHKEKAFLRAMKGCTVKRIGTVTDDATLRIAAGGTSSMLSLAALSAAYHAPYNDF